MITASGRPPTRISSGSLAMSVSGRPTCPPSIRITRRSVYGYRAVTYNIPLY
ncbi:MAG: hypothetical protein ACRDSM_05110 [Pseudonocardiaceae bacterium]